MSTSSPGLAGSAPAEASYRYTNQWFEYASLEVWERLVLPEHPSRVLEIGSYEGQSACFLIERIASSRPLELHCLDTWEGGEEHQAGATAATDMSEVEQRFRHNTSLAASRAAHAVTFQAHKGYSDASLIRLLAEGRAGSFDFVYVDGSHQAPDVLADAVLGFRLLRVGGVIGFDDYLWDEPPAYGKDPVRSPKLAVDAFTSIHCRKLQILYGPNHQVYARKTSD